MHNMLILINIIENFIKKYILSQLLKNYQVTVESCSPEPTCDLRDVTPGLPVSSVAQCPVTGNRQWLSGKSSLADHYTGSLDV
jgi:hypothetical protein